VIGKLLLPQKAFVLHEPIATADQKQTNKIEQRALFLLALLQRFQPIGDCGEHGLVSPGNAYFRSVDGTDVIHNREGYRSQESGASRNTGILLRRGAGGRWRFTQLTINLGETINVRWDYSDAYTDV
jgi:hypothetical protein